MNPHCDGTTAQHAFCWCPANGAGTADVHAGRCILQRPGQCSTVIGVIRISHAHRVLIQSIFRRGGHRRTDDLRRVVYWRDGNGKDFTVRSGTVFAAIIDGNGHRTAAEHAFERCPGNQAGTTDNHAGRRIAQLERQVGTVIRVIRVAHCHLIAVLHIFSSSGRRSRGDHRRVVHGIQRDGPALGIGDSAIFTAIRYSQGDIGSGDAIGRCPLHQTGSADRHACRRLIQTPDQRRTIIGIVRIIHGGNIGIQHTLGTGS